MKQSNHINPSNRPKAHGPNCNNDTHWNESERGKQQCMILTLQFIELTKSQFNWIETFRRRKKRTHKLCDHIKIVPNSIIQWNSQVRFGIEWTARDKQVTKTGERIVKKNLYNNCNATYKSNSNTSSGI